jgi:AcrR family transcriptional regulator
LSGPVGVTERARPGRPSTGARERILEAGLEVLKAEGFAGMTIAKVAAAAGENKALIGYHFGSKQGLVAAVGREVGASITEEVVTGIGRARSIDGVVRGVLDAVWRVMDRDVRIARVYFDLTAVSVVEPNVREVMQEVRAGWRAVLARMLREAEPRLGPAAAATAALFVHTGVEGLVLERVEAGESTELERARRLFQRSAVRAIEI